MSTLKTHNLQSSDSGSVNIAMTPNAGMIVAGLSTYSNQVNVGSNIKLGNAGVITATSFVGSGANLTGLPAETTINGNTDHNVVTATGTANTLQGESTLTFNNGQLDVTQTTSSSDAKLVIRNSNTPGSGSLRLEFHYGTGNTEGTDRYRFGYVEGFRAGGSNDGGLKFGTKPSNAAAPTERLRIDSSGRLIQRYSAAPYGNRAATFQSPAGETSTYIAVINTETNGASGILFGDHAGQNAGNFDAYINYSHQYQHMQFLVGSGTERLRIGSQGQIGIGGGNYGAARQAMVSNGSGSAVSWSSNPLLLDMDSLGDIDYDGVFLRYRETATVTGNGLVYLGLCKSTTNCPAGRIGVPVGFIPSTVYNGHFRVDKVGITPWPDGSGHRYEYYAIISDYVSSGKLGVFYLTNSTN